MGTSVKRIILTLYSWNLHKQLNECAGGTTSSDGIAKKALNDSMGTLATGNKNMKIIHSE